MRIRHLLILGIALACTLVMVRMVVLEVRFLQDKELERVEIDIARVSRDASRLVVLSQEYLLHKRPTTSSQWFGVHVELLYTLSVLTGGSSELQQQVSTLSKIALDLPMRFDTLLSTARNGTGSKVQAKVDLLADDLVAQTQRISDGVLVIAERLAEDRRARGAIERRMVFATMGFIAALILAITVVAVRRVLEPMAKLESTAQAVQAGDLGARSGYRAKDEFGDLSRVFDSMTQTLQEREVTLHASNERFAIASDSAGIGVWEYDVINRSVTWDQWMFRLYGHSHEDETETYELWTTSVHPQDRERCDGEIAAALQGTKEFDTEFRVVRPDGEVRYLKASARTLRGPDGSALRMMGVTFDVTERHHAKLQLMETLSLLSSVLDSASEVAIIATDPSLKITIFNVGAQRLLGYSSEELVGQATPIAIHDPDEVRMRGQELSALLGHVVEGGAVFVEQSMLQQAHEWTYVRKDGGRVPVSLVVTAMHTNEGKLLGYLGVAHDVTRQKQYEKSLREAMHKAEKASLAKSQFLANMSHEIRTPMNAVVGLTYLLGRTTLDEEQAAFVAKIKVASKSLLVVINDVLDLSKIEAGELTVERATFSPHALLKDLAEVMGVHANEKGIGFEINTPDDLPVALEGDATRLNQVLTNLLSNAIKFTERGGVKLHVRQLAKTSKTVTLRFEVQDSGIGIAPEAQSRIFAPFAQADESTTRRFGGTGLGLSIVKRLVTLMGGEVGLSSIPSVGSEFTATLEFALASPEALVVEQVTPAIPGERALKDVRVLVVDDSDINLEVARRILGLEGALVELASNGEEALQCLDAQPQAFDVVLMDIQMPVLDGYGATRRIRGDPRLAHLPIIALTSGALTDERHRAATSGMNDFISKPFDAQALVRSILRHVQPASVQHLRPTDGAGAQAAVRWPEIDGIDSSDVRERLSDDLGLFRSALKRLLEEFSDVEIAAIGQDPTALTFQAGRMHKLRGSAGLLGAKVIQELAGEAEAACASGAGERAAYHATRLVAQLQRLRQSSAPTLEVARHQAEETLPSDEALDPKVLVELLDLLRQQSLSALERFNAISPQLRRMLGKDLFERVYDQIENLQFSEVANALAEIGSA